MAIDANSIPMPAAQGITPSPPALTAGQEFLHLVALRRQITDRLEKLVEILDDDGSNASRDFPPSITLPLSSLRQAVPGTLLFRGGARD